MSFWRYSNRNSGVPRDYFKGGTGANPRTQWRMRQDTTINRVACIPALGEPFWDTDTDDLYVGDGTTLGGILISGDVDTKKVKVSADDTTEGYLLAKLAAGANITLTETTPGGNETVTIAAVIPPGGDVTGPGSSTDNAIARFDGTTGKIIQNSLAILSDNGNIATPGRLALYDAAISAGTTLNLEETFVNTSGSRYGIDALTQLSAASAGSANVTGIRAQAVSILMTGPQTGILTGVEGYALAGDSDGPTGGIRGVWGHADVALGATVAYGVQGTVEWSSATAGSLIAGGVFNLDIDGAATITNAYGIGGLIDLNNGSGTITNAYGGYFRVSKVLGATITNAIGIRINNSSPGVNNYPLQIGEAAGGAQSWNLAVPALSADWTLTVPTTDGNAYETLMTDGSGVTSWSPKAYSFRGFYPGQPTDSEIMDVWRTDRAYTMADDFAGSYAVAETGATVEQIWTVHKATGLGAFSQIGTITFAAGGSGGRQAGTFATSGGSVAMTAGDCLKVVSAASTDATIANVSIVWKGALAE